MTLTAEYAPILDCGNDEGFRIERLESLLSLLRVKLKERDIYQIEQLFDRKGCLIAQLRCDIPSGAEIGDAIEAAWDELGEPEVEIYYRPDY